MNERLPSKHVVLLGMGHTNAHVLRMYGMHGLEDTALTCISNFNVATYSGMLPAVLAGQVPREKMQIDLVQLCASVGARLITEPVTGLDPESRNILFQHRPPMEFDLLSIGTGSTSMQGELVVNGGSVVAIKPMQTFLERLQHTLTLLHEKQLSRPLRVVVAGSGAAGLEIAFCLPPFLDKNWGGDHEISIVTRSSRLLAAANAHTRKIAIRQLHQRKIEIITNFDVQSIQDEYPETPEGKRIDADLVIWSTGAGASDFLGQLQLATDEKGFLVTHPTLQSITTPHVFAVGDAGTISTSPTPKAGVYAVRQGPILWENIQRSLVDAPLVHYRPQRSFLQLLNTGDGKAIGQWKRFAMSNQWLMAWKKSIDSRFMEMFEPVRMEDDEDPMQCRGCGCKIGSGLLDSALSSAGTLDLDDAAVIAQTAEDRIIASTDFFTSPFEDPYLTGRIAALHAASDIVASGASAQHALSNIVLPEGDSAAQGRTLRELLAGAKREFDAMGAAIAGGHTIEGPRLEIGFTVIGKAIGKNLLEKKNLQTGDGLYLTKPIGIGVLLAARMRGRCAAHDHQHLINAMLDRQHEYAHHAIEAGISAGTDITGFGLAGHLLEMLEASQKSAVLTLNDIPTLPGSTEAVLRGIQSSLSPSNRMSAAKISTTADIRKEPQFDLLFDPQTCGGLLLGVSNDQLPTLQSLVGDRLLVRIGTVFDASDVEKSLIVN